MRSPVPRVVWTCLALIASTDASHAASPPAPAAATTTALQAIFHDDWERNLRENPTFASTLGDRRRNGQWDDATVEANDRSHQEDVATLDRLHKLNRRRDLRQAG